MHRLERELRDSIDELLDWILEGSVDGVWYWDLENPDEEWMDPRFWRILGYDPKEKRHSPDEWMNLIHPEDLETAKTNLERHLADPSHRYDQIVRYRRGPERTDLSAIEEIVGERIEYVVVRCRGKAILDGGKPVRMIGVRNDLTNLVPVLDAIRKKNRDHEERIEKLELRCDSCDRRSS